MSVLTFSIVNAQTEPAPTLSRTQANNYIQSKYPDAVAEGESALFTVDKNTREVKIINPDANPEGKIKVIETTWWMIGDGETTCIGVTIFYVHIVAGVQVCSGHWGTSGFCNY